MTSNIFFSENEIPKPYSIGATTYFYNEDDCIAYKYKKDLLSFYILKRKEKLVIGRIHFVISGNEAISLPKSPFGSFELYETMTLNVLNDFVCFIFERLQEKHVNNIVISTFAQIYNQQASAKVHYVLSNNGFKILATDINHHIPIEGNFKDRIISMQFRKLKKCKKEGLIFKEEKLSKLKELYFFISKCRNERGQNLSMDYHQLRNATNLFPERYKLFSVFKEGERLAATVAVIVNEEILYNFYPASMLQFNALSPMVFLTAGLFDYCCENNYKILDLGTSSLAEKPNIGLISFKEGIGGKPSLKFVFEKSLN